MRFERKIFIAVFCATLLIGSTLIWAAYRYVSMKSRDEFISRYKVFTHVLADTLTRLDTSTEALMANAAQVVTDRDTAKGIPSNEELKAMRSQLGMTHIFMADKNGKFIRSTNEDPQLIPNLYSFCDSYKGILDGTSTQNATPIIKPEPEPKPFKFLLMPNAAKNRIVEVGVRVDSIAKTLIEAVKADKNIRSMSLYAPNGTSFGRFSAENVNFDEPTASLPEDLSASIDHANDIHFYSRVISSHPQCCQCDKSGTSKNGEYYYVLESAVSKDDLKAVEAKMRLTFVLLALGNLIVSFLVAKLLSRRLVRNIRTAVQRVRNIKQNDNLGERINLEGKDEVAFLTQEFDKLLGSLQESQKRLVEAEKSESKIQLARVVAHNIRSPIIAIEMMLPQLLMVSSQTRRILSNSVKEIKSLSEKLRYKPESVIVGENADILPDEFVFIPHLIQDVISQKKIEFSEQTNIEIISNISECSSTLLAKVNAIELKSILSNLINNALESYGDNKGKVEVCFSADGNSCEISVRDRGCGISVEYLKDLGRKQITSKGSNERGLGLVHAFSVLESWGEKIEITSENGQGTSVRILLKLSKAINYLKIKYEAEPAQETV